MRKISVFPTIMLLLGLALYGFAPGEVSADGTESLGPPLIPIASGTGIVAAGTGMASQPGTIDVNVPVGATVEQVLLYWSGFVPDPGEGDPVITVNSTDVTGTLIGGPRPDVTLSGAVFNEVTYRADITGLGLVGAGLTTLTVEGLDFAGGVANGAGALVIFDDSSDPAHIDLRDGLDGAYAPDPPPLDTTDPQTFSFGPAASDRTATLALFFTSVSGTASGGGFRPSAIEITSGGSVDVRDNLLDSVDGEEWDTVILSVVVPAGATSLTVQALSVDNLGIGGNPASMNWITAGLSVPPPEPCIDIEKLVSVDGGQTFLDADDCAEAPTTDMSAEYKLIVSNCGDEDLENVVVNDVNLGISDYPVGNLAVDESIELLQGDIPQLFFEGLCEAYEQFENVAMAAGSGVTSQAVVMDDDPACVICSVPEPCIRIEKLVSVDDAETFLDADDCAEAPTTDMSAEYKLIVSNCGDEDLENVVINDEDLGIVSFPVGDLPVDGSVTLMQGDIEQLFYEGLCEEWDEFTNIARADGTGAISGQPVSDEDPACVICEETGREGCTPGYWKGEHHFDSWPSGYSPTDLFSDVFGVEITIMWSETGKPQPTPNPTLLQALEANGGDINELARHAVAGLLSAAHPDVAYPYSVGDVKDLFDDGDAGALVEANELGCPLNNSPEEELEAALLANIAACGTTPSVAGGTRALNLGSLVLVFGALLFWRKLARIGR